MRIVLLLVVLAVIGLTLARWLGQPPPIRAGTRGGRRHRRASRADPASGLKTVRSGPQPVHAGRRQPTPP